MLPAQINPGPNPLNPLQRIARAMADAAPGARQPAADPFALPTTEELDAVLELEYESNNVATRAQRTIIDAATTRRLNNPAHRKQLYLAFAFLCADLGSATQTVYPGTNHGVEYQTLAGIIKGSGATIRQFAGYYAKVVYVTLKNRDRPPANWSRKGFTFATRFAAFDFFPAITARSALDPATPVNPTPEELRSHSANAAMAQHLSQADAGSSTRAQYTMGRVAAPTQGLLTQ